MNMTIENALMYCDITRPLDYMAGLLKYGRLHQIEWRGNPSGMELEKMLRRYRIHAYGRFCQYEILQDAGGKKHKVLRHWAHINYEQANWAEYLCMCASVPLEGNLLNAKNAEAWGKGLPRAWEDGTPAETWIERFGDFLDWLGR